MPVYLEDPSVLTKERLKSELLAHNVELPGGNPPKDVYVQLYLKTLTAQNKRHGPDTALDAFSSDEELPPVVSRRSRSSGRKSEAVVEQLDLALLTDEGLRDQLLKHGVDAGPIVASTRKLYERKLQKLLDNGPVLSEQLKHNGSGEAELYSDREDEVTAAPDPEPDPDLDPEPDPEPVPVLKEPVRSHGNHTAQTHSSSQHSTVEKITVEQPPEENLLHTEHNLFTGPTATCRRPIRGAAGRPTMPTDQHHNPDYTSRTNSSSFLSHTESCRRINHSTPSSTAPAPSDASSAPSNASSTPFTSRCASGAPSACQAKAGGMSWWKKLLLLAVLALFLFFVYQAMEINSTNPFEESKAVSGSTA